MAIATNHSLLEGNTGKVGQLVMRIVNKQTVISSASRGRSKKSELEKENHTHFQQAAAFAKSSMMDPELKAHFKSIAKRRKLSNAYTAALSLKLRELKAEEKRKKALTMASVIPDDAADVASANNFKRVCQDTENVFNELLRPLSNAWRNLKIENLNAKQVEVLRTIVREQIRRGFNFI